MFGPDLSAWCTNCGEEFDPIPGVLVCKDPDEPRFCSDNCADAWSAAVDAEEVYYSDAGGAPVFP